jgi:hypothetical protein
MFSFFKPDADATSASSSQGAGATQFQSTLQGDGTLDEVIGMLWDEICQMHGIPSTWVRCEVRDNDATGLRAPRLVELVVWHWNPQLVLHGPALQNKLLAGIARSSPRAGSAGLQVVWRYEPSCGYPTTELPDHFSTDTGPLTSQDSMLDSRGNIRII